MKKVYLTKVVQKNKEFYAMVEDPRLIVKLLPDIKAGESQEAQRPWNLKKVKEITNYVAGRVKMSKSYKALGIIPNNPILAIKSPLKVENEKINIEVDGIIKEEVRYYLLIPENESEREKYKGCIEAIDGQHRLIAFREEYRDPLFSDDIKYSMVFSIFENLSIDERKEVFMITNEKQDKVSTNLIRLLKRALGLLGDGKKSFDIVDKLNKEPYSVLNNRIMFGSEKIAKGYKENQLSKIIEKSGTLDTLEKYIADNNIDTMTKIISNYLKAWEDVYKVSFQSPQKDTITKISGLRYILFLFPEIMDSLVNNKKIATKENFEDIISKISVAIKIDNVFENEATALAFRGEGATIKLSKSHSKLLATYILSESSRFDPTKGI